MPSDIASPATPVNIEKVNTVAEKTTRRPQRSATQPQHQEPMPMPASAADPARPICCGVSPNSSRIFGSA